VIYRPYIIIVDELLVYISVKIINISIFK